MLINPVGMFGRGGSFAALELGITAGIIVLVALGISLFARRIAAAGSLYTFVTRGLGSTAGMAAGAGLALGYASVSLTTLSGAARQITLLIAPSTASPGPGTNATDLPWAAILIVGALAVLIGTVMIIGARVSTRVMLGIEIVAVSLIIAVSFIVLSATGWDLSPLVPDVAHPPSFSSLVGAVGFGLIAFVGFESGVALGPESKRPLATVPRTLFLTVAVLCVVYLVGVYAQLAVIARYPNDGYESLFQVASTAVQLPGLAVATNLIIAASFVACSLACASALVRLVFTMAREGVLPAFLGATSRRFGTPHQATLVTVAVIALLAALTLAIPGSVLGAVAHRASTLGFVVAYLLVCLAGPVFLVRLREFTLAEALPAFAAGVALGIILVGQIGTVEPDRALGLGITLGIVALVVLWHRVRMSRDPQLRDRTGLYDSPIASDGIAGAEKSDGGGREL